MKLPLKIFLIALAVMLGGYGVARVCGWCESPAVALSKWSQNYVYKPEKIHISTESIKITDGGLRLYFNPGNVGSNADGVIEVELTNEELSSLGVPTPWKQPLKT